jgi:hypothetical protein
MFIKSIYCLNKHKKAKISTCFLAYDKYIDFTDNNEYYLSYEMLFYKKPKINFRNQFLLQKVFQKTNEYTIK